MEPAAVEAAAQAIEAEADAHERRGRGQRAAYLRSQARQMRENPVDFAEQIKAQPLPDADAVRAFLPQLVEKWDRALSLLIDVREDVRSLVEKLVPEALEPEPPAPPIEPPTPDETAGGPAEPAPADPPDPPHTDTPIEGAADGSGPEAAPANPPEDTGFVEVGDVVVGDPADG